MQVDVPCELEEGATLELETVTVELEETTMMLDETGLLLDELGVAMELLLGTFVYTISALVNVSWNMLNC